jgi:hypothetical protein
MYHTKRTEPRILTETLCNEVVADRDHFGLIVDLSESGVRIERPLRGRNDSRIVQLEFELPGVDEIVWAKGEICFDQLRRGRDTGPVRTSGVRLVAAASRHLRMLRDWVRAAADARRDEHAWVLAHASHWAG